MYDSFVMQLVTEYAIKFDAKYTDAFLGFMIGPSNKSDRLIDNLNRMTSELSSGEATKNNISEILKDAYKKYPDYAVAHRSSAGASGLAPSNTNINFTIARYANFIDFALLGYNIEFSLIGLSIFYDLGRFFSNAPKKVKTEEITVQALYKRTMDMKLDVLEKRFVNSINQSRAGILNGMTLEEFAKSDDKNKGLVKAAQKLCELLNAYFRFELAELNYYYRILIEVDSKLSIKEAKKTNGPITIVTKESTDEVVDMEDFMDLESFVSEI